MCPDKSCTVEGKDWQALMRHYTGKHGILEAYLKEVLASGLLNNKENYVHRGHPSKLQMNRGPRIPVPSRRKKRPSTTSSEGSSSSSSAGKDVPAAMHHSTMMGKLGFFSTSSSDKIDSVSFWLGSEFDKGPTLKVTGDLQLKLARRLASPFRCHLMNVVNDGGLLHEKSSN
jgi:hypothetical protein